MSNSIRVAVIMAGGSGERFWPLSRCDRPKQLLSLTDPHRTMLEVAVQLIEPLIPREQVFVVTSRNLIEPTLQGRGDLPAENIIAEPARRNTCGCLAYAAAVLLARYDRPPEEITMAVVTADHQIGDHPRFLQILDAAMAVAESGNALGVVGIKPTRPETGYGYVEIGAEAKPLAGSRPGLPTYPVARFREKPNREMAEELIETGLCFWNSGMFFWRLSSFLTEMQEANPEMHQAIVSMVEALRADDAQKVEEIFVSMRSLPIDIALMERAKNVVITPADFAWEDVGSWDALARTHALDANGNVALGNPVVIDSRNSIIYNASLGRGKEVAVVGVEGLAVVVTDDAVLVVSKERAQDVKRAVEELKKRGSSCL